MVRLGYDNINHGNHSNLDKISYQIVTLTTVYMVAIEALITIEIMVIKYMQW